MDKADIETVTLAAHKGIWKAIGHSIASKHQREVVKDLTQETFAKVLVGFDPERGTLGACAYQYAYNLATDYHRGRACYGSNHGATSLTVSDDSGNDITMDIGDVAPSALDSMIARERDADIAKAIEALPESGQRAIGAMLDDEGPMTGGDRIAKMRAVDAMQEIVKSPGYVARAVAKRTKAKREAKPEIEAKPEGAPQRGLSCLMRWDLQCKMFGTPVDIMRYSR